MLTPLEVFPLNYFSLARRLTPRFVCWKSNFASAWQSEFGSAQLLNKSQEETLTITERKNCGCTVGSMRVQLVLFINGKNKEWNIFVPCPIEKGTGRTKQKCVVSGAGHFYLGEKLLLFESALLYSHLRTIWTEARYLELTCGFGLLFFGFFLEVALTHQVSMPRMIQSFLVFTHNSELNASLFFFPNWKSGI